MASNEDVPFELICNPFNARDSKLTDTERLKLLEAGLIFSGRVNFVERGIMRRRTPLLTADELGLFAEAVVEVDLGEWPDADLPSGLWKCPNLRELSCQGSQLITSVSPAIGRMKHLTTLQAGRCSRLRFLPFEITHTLLPQYRHKLSFPTEEREAQPLPELPCFPAEPLSLKELVARVIVRQPPEDERPKATLPTDLESFLHSAKRCSQCQGPFFDQYFACWSSLDSYSWRVPLLSISCSRKCAKLIPYLMVADGQALPPPSPPRYYSDDDSDWY